MTTHDKHSSAFALDCLNRILRHLKARFGLRHATRLPHFLVIGTQKGGTTSLHHLLSQHQVFFARSKEVHYLVSTFMKVVSGMQSLLNCYAWSGVVISRLLIQY